MSDPLRVLVVDDEPGMRRSLCDILLDEGYLVVAAADGARGGEACERQPFDVVLIDVRIPGPGAADAFRRIRRHRPAARVILMSAFGPEDLRQQALDDGAAALVRGPLDDATASRLVEHGARILAFGPDANDEMMGRVRDALQGRGYGSAPARSLHEALDAVDGPGGDVLLVRSGAMPAGDRHACFAVRALTPATVAALVAGCGDEFLGRVGEGSAGVAYAFVRKPLDLDHLLGLLEQVRRHRGDPAAG